jgi:AsmA protein
MKRLLFGLAFAGGFAASLAATKHLVPAEIVRAELAKTLSGLAGLPVTLSGPAEISVFPSLKVRFQDLAVRVATDGESLAEVRELAVRLDVLPLLIGRVSVSEISLSGPSIRLARALTLDGLVPGKAVLAGLEPARMTVEGGRVLLRDPASGQEERIDDVVASLIWPRPASGMSLETTFRWRGEAVAVALQGASPRSLAEGQASAASFTLTSAPLRLAFEGKGLLLDRLQLDGAIRIAAPDGGRVAAWFGAPAVAMTVLKDITLDGRMRSLGLAATISDARLALDGNRGDGVLSVRLDAPRPQVRGTLAFDSFDMGGYVAALSGGAWRSTPLDARRLASFDLDLRLSAAALRAGSVEAERIAATLLAKDGRFDAEIGEATVFGGAARAVIRGEAKPEGVRVSGRVTGSDLLAARLSGALGIASVEDGRLAVQTEGEAKGDTVGRLVDSFTGRIHAEARQIVIRNAEAAAPGGLPVQKIAFSSSGPQRGSTFERAVADAIIVERVAHVHRLEAHNAAMTARLTGEASLANGNLSLAGQVSVPDGAAEVRGQGPRRSVPVRIGGTVFRPVAAVVPDAVAPTTQP